MVSPVGAEIDNIWVVNLVAKYYVAPTPERGWTNREYQDLKYSSLGQANYGLFTLRDLSHE